MSRIAAVATALLVCLVSPLPASPQATAKKAGAGQPAKFSSLPELRKHFSSERDAAVKALQEKELSALKTYAAGKPADREQALFAAQQIASEIESFGDARALCDQFLAEFPSADGATAVKLSRAIALTHVPGQMKDALAGFDDVVASAGDDKQLVFNALMHATDAHLEAGDSASALKTLDRLGEELKAIPQVGQIVMRRRAEISAIGTTPKTFEVKDQNGQPLSLENLKGKVVLVDFWATWCGPCREELPNVLAAYEKFHSKGFEIVGVSLDEDEKAFREFIKSEGMTWPQFFDGNGWENELAQLYGVQSIPATYLLDREGKIVRIGLRGEALSTAVEKLLAQAPAKK